MQTSEQFDFTTRIGFLANRETVSRIRIRWNSCEGLVEGSEKRLGFADAISRGACE